MRVATAAIVRFPMAICVYYAAVVVAFAICLAKRYKIQDTRAACTDGSGWGSVFARCSVLAALCSVLWCLGALVVPGQIINREPWFAGVSPVSRFPYPVPSARSRGQCLSHGSRVTCCQPQLATVH